MTGLGGSKGLVQNSGNLCGRTMWATVAMKGRNGAGLTDHRARAVR
jgi:hypothetical protein